MSDIQDDPLVTLLWRIVTWAIFISAYFQHIYIYIYMLSSDTPEVGIKPLQVVVSHAVAAANWAQDLILFLMCHLSSSSSLFLTDILKGILHSTSLWILNYSASFKKQDLLTLTIPFLTIQMDASLASSAVRSTTLSHPQMSFHCQ